VDAVPLIPVDNEEARKKRVDDLPITPGEIILVEMMKSGKKSLQWTFEEIYVGKAKQREKNAKL
jgi:hypothetical protein